ncbi:hypothetical protein DFH05DRAFT_1458813 [Lentinula detonsa]|uniref:PWI domain-containing protein n=1 Tax=Lentinula detonsa TaxID=2804962 RepID=A0A9W8TZT0_9AGAR|nr:hypothetical protein DFH05DRAFT_1458813 [Lentinula detonsa]
MVSLCCCARKISFCLPFSGFFEGSSADQDRRFSEKELKLLKSMKFPPEFDKKVDMRKVNLTVIRPWIAKKVVEIVGFEDEAVVEYAMGLLEDKQEPTPDPKKMQINLTGFLTEDTPAFMSALWKLLLEVQSDMTVPTPSTVSTLLAPLENDPPPSINTPDRRFPRPLTSRKLRDSEREAKEREYAEGQHANHIEGVWHCSNCGCPESIAIGRRKGPLGNKSQCGDCGRFWHRHRRPRPCTYSTDAEYHISLTKKKGSAATLRVQDSSVSTPIDDLSAPSTPARDRKKGRSESPSRQSPPASRAVSPIPSSSSASEPPLSQRVKSTNGTAGSTDAGESRKSKDPITKNEPEPSTLPRTNVQIPPRPPSWLTTTMHSTQTIYPKDKFDVVWRKVSDGSEWRIKCVDCPGKLYKLGPGETLSNFEVHLKNRQHRHRVDNRIDR